MQLVENNSKISYSKSDLMDPNNEQTIEWRQSLSAKSAHFVQLLATLTSDNTSKVLFFVERDMAEQLLSASTAKGGDKYEVTVHAPNFRYGQDSAKDPKFRFLVYLNPSYAPYQHRFLNQTTAAKLAALAKKIPDISAYVTLVKGIIDLAGSIIGDPLRAFEG